MTTPADTKQTYRITVEGDHGGMMTAKRVIRERLLRIPRSITTHQGEAKNYFEITGSFSPGEIAEAVRWFTANHKYTAKLQEESRDEPRVRGQIGAQLEQRIRRAEADRDAARHELATAREECQGYKDLIDNEIIIRKGDTYAQTIHDLFSQKEAATYTAIAAIFEQAKDLAAKKEILLEELPELLAMAKAPFDELAEVKKVRTKLDQFDKLGDKAIRAELRETLPEINEVCRQYKAQLDLLRQQHVKAQTIGPEARPLAAKFQGKHLPFLVIEEGDATYLCLPAKSEDTAALTTYLSQMFERHFRARKVRAARQTGTYLTFKVATERAVLEEILTSSPLQLLGISPAIATFTTLRLYKSEQQKQAVRVAQPAVQSPTPPAGQRVYDMMNLEDILDRARDDRLAIPDPRNLFGRKDTDFTLYAQIFYLLASGTREMQAIIHGLEGIRGQLNRQEKTAVYNRFTILRKTSVIRSPAQAVYELIPEEVRKYQ